MLTRRIGASTDEAERSEVEILSDRELEVFKFIGQGASTQEIAE